VDALDGLEELELLLEELDDELLDLLVLSSFIFFWLCCACVTAGAWACPVSEVDDGFC
jgi:hypothetical protein